MPWCPKCKSEYREGFAICADCGSPLVESEPREETEDALTEENLAQQMGTEEEEPEEQQAGFRVSAPYQDSSQRASDNRSSAWILMSVGALGLLLVVLGVAEVLPLRLNNPYLFFGVMGAVFLLFLVAGIVSMKNARIFDKKAESENSLRSTMLDWCRENLRSAEIDELVGSDGLPEEILYFKRSAHIKERLNHQFVNLDQDFLDQFVDDRVYDMVFDSSMQEPADAAECG